MFKEGCAALIICLLCVCCLCLVMMMKNQCVKEPMTEHKSASVQNISLKDLERKIKSGEAHNSCVVFHADWCGHCQHLKQSGELEKVAQNNCQVYLVDGDKNDVNKLSEYDLEIQGFPTICVVNDNKLKEVNTGRTHKDILKALKN